MKIYRFFKYYLLYLPVFTFLKWRKRTGNFPLRGKVFEIETKKHKEFLKKTKDKLFFARIVNWFISDLMLISDTSSSKTNINKPTIIVVVHNELEKLKLCIKYHQNMGFENFIVIANNSPEEIIQWLKALNNSKVYFTNSKFNSHYKSAWIQKAIAINGYNKWYLVLDCDELFDYPGNNNNLEILIKKLDKTGNTRPLGYLIDFYSDKNLYESNCNWEIIPKELNYFDKDSYEYRKFYEPYTKENIYTIWGGFRQRCFDIDILLSKESLFNFKENYIYECHFIFPLIQSQNRKCDYVLRHYKFLKKDYEEFVLRAKQGNFSLKSAKYKNYVNPNYNFSPKYSGSIKYENSDSLKNLPFLAKK